MIVVMTTVADEDSAVRLASGLVNGQLAVCVQILPPMTSIYVWQGETRREREHLLLVKTLKEKYAETERFIRENHPYETPEIIGIPADEFSKAYFDWVKAAVGRSA